MPGSCLVPWVFVIICRLLQLRKSVDKKYKRGGECLQCLRSWGAEHLRLKHVNSPHTRPQGTAMIWGRKRWGSQVTYIRVKMKP